ncbi:MAG: hypothetical protein IPF50_15840 [Proteobacteria bacterium]|nr:hypothetical protein [Pseudomonadota bacterium]
MTVIDLDTLLAQVRDVMDKATLAVQYVFLFTLLAGLMVLLAAVQATRDERRYESAMLRTLGASRKVVFQGVAANSSCSARSPGCSRRPARPRPVTSWRSRSSASSTHPTHGCGWSASSAGAVLVGTAGILAARSVVSHPPLQALRADL